MTCVYTFPNGDVVRGKPALKAYLVENLASLLPDRAEAAGFRRTPVQQAARVSPAQAAMVERMANGIAGTWANRPKVEFFTSLQDANIPEAVRKEDTEQRKLGAAGDVEGFYLRGTVYVNQTLKTPEDVVRVMFHEGLGHYGLRGVYGKGLTDVLEQIVALRKPDVLAKAKQYGLDPKDPAAMLKAAEEVLATMAQTKPSTGFVQRAIAAIRAWLRQNVPGFSNLQMSDAEVIQRFIMPARAYVEQGAKVGRDMADAVSFSRAAPAPTGLVLPEQGLLRRVQAAVQDNMNRVRQVQERIEKLIGRALPGYADYYGAETNRPGRIAARLEDFRKQMTQPLMEKLAKSGHTADELGTLLHAMHAQERNDAIAKINPDMPDGGSGMTNAEADAILTQYRTNTKLHALADEARAIARATLDLKLAYHLIDRETYNTLAQVYVNYVPLKGDGEYGPKIKRAMGHDARDEQILENLARDYELATIAGEKNLARQALLQMVLQNPDKELWTVGVPPRGRYVAGSVFSVRENGKEVATFTSQAQVSAFLEGKGAKAANFNVWVNGERVREFVKPLQDNEVMVYVDGQGVRIQIVGDEKLASQLRPLDQGKMGVILETMRGVNRYLSKIYTGYNPAFIIKNTLRDAMTGTINIMGNESAGTAARAWANYPAAMKALASYAATGKVPAGDAGKMLQEYRQNGGKTGASYMSDLEEQGKSLQRMFDDAYGATGYLGDKRYAKAAAVAGRKIVGGMAHTIEVLNQATENGLRLSLYMAMRNQGVSPGEAAQAAKSVTVDFDRKGTLSPALGAIFLFFNPAVQGTANALKTLAKGKNKQQAWAALGALALLGVYAAGQGMDEDKDEWLGEDWGNRSRNLILNVGGSRIKVPLSMEFAPFYGLGVALGEAKRGESAMKAAGHVVSSFIDAYFPLQGAFNSESDNPQMDLAMATVPTVLKPFMQSATNRNSFGSQVMPESEMTKDRPDNLKMFKGTKGSVYDQAAQGIASAGELTGAGRYENDITKVSPETLKLMWRTYTGGLGLFVTDLAGLANVGAQGAAEMSDVPVVKDFVKPGEDVRLIRGRFYDLTKEARTAATEFQQAKKAGDGEAMDKILDRPEKAELLGLDKLIKSTTQAATQIRDEMLDINQDASLSLPEKRAKLKELEREEELLYRDAIAAFR
ncbi:MAG: LPD38 domain-containing protein [Aestuariivirga sp.]